MGVSAGKRPAVFLDRDGTVIEDRHYLSDPQGVRVLPGAAQAVARLNRAGILAVLVTNQSGIGRGYFSESDFLAVQRRMVQALAAAGAHLDGMYHCPHSPEHVPPCDCRKPAVGLFELAARELGINLAHSFFIGDRLRDVTPAGRWGGTGILVGGDAEAADVLPAFCTTADTLEAAVDQVLAADAAD
jgi:D-glycero-D-manno-heptose 1,7-bisphosphate phosphatase